MKVKAKVRNNDLYYYLLFTILVFTIFLTYSISMKANDKNATISTGILEDVSIKKMYLLLKHNIYSLLISENIKLINYENATDSKYNLKPGILKTVFNETISIMKYDDPDIKVGVKEVVKTSEVKIPEIKSIDISTDKDNLINVFKNGTKDEIVNAERRFFIYDSGVNLKPDELKYEEVLGNKKETIDLSKKKILIFHTHSQEKFKNDVGSIVDIGELVAKTLTNKYKLNVIHYKGEHDIVDGRVDRNGSYERVESAINQILEEDSNIEFLIDLHRDGLPESRKIVTEIDGKPTAQIMFVNGLSKLYKNGGMEDIDYLPNPNLNGNLNFSMSMQIASEKLYPDISRRILLKPYRYSLHMKPNSLLIEIGSQNCTFDEVKNVVEPLCEIIYNGLKNL